MKLLKAETGIGRAIIPESDPSEALNNLNSSSGLAELELWGGIECTVNRVGDTYFDQIERTGHGSRVNDLSLFAKLGISAIRYPVLWERIAPNGLQHADWTWTDARLAHLRELKIRPIAGLLHHGSGPAYTSLIDPAFPEKLAEYARAVAMRYPWVEHYTPINEPLTTARFSGLYGHWYPHGHDDHTFAVAFLNQCRAIILSMRAIREIVPHAQLIQTEDLGKVYSTPALAYQAQFENQRRWLTWDILSGRFNNSHPLWNYFLRKAEIPEPELSWFGENYCVPDIIGINHYLTSERFLDERLERYPEHLHGGNSVHGYADLEAVRVLEDGVAGPGGMLQETWERYHLPMAVTEAHLHCTREQQLRWFREIWSAASELRSSNVDIRAVTAWSLLGAYDWDSLLTRCKGNYEPGAFDLRGPFPRPTALAEMLRNLGVRGTQYHPVVHAEGWWQGSERLLYPPIPGSGGTKSLSRLQKKSAPRPLLITGTSGVLNLALEKICARRGINYVLLNSYDADITDHNPVENAISQYHPWGIIDTSGYMRMETAGEDWRPAVNACSPSALAEICHNHMLPFMSFSCDCMSDERGTHYHSRNETGLPILEHCPNALIIRTGMLFGPWDEQDTLATALESITSGIPFMAADDLFFSPTYLPDLINAGLDLMIDAEHGVWDLATGNVSPLEFYRMAAVSAGLDPELILPCPAAEAGTPGQRPRSNMPAGEQESIMPPLKDAITNYIREYREAAATADTPDRQQFCG